MHTFRDNSTPIKSLAVTDNCLCLVFCNEPKTVYYDNNASQCYYNLASQYHPAQGTGALMLGLISKVYPNCLSRVNCSLNVQQIARSITNNIFLTKTERADIFIQFNLNQGTLREVKVAAPAFHQGFQTLSLLKVMPSNTGDDEVAAPVFHQGFHSLSPLKVMPSNTGCSHPDAMYHSLYELPKTQEFVCFILWGSKAAVKSIGSRNQQLLITMFESIKGQNTRTWKVSDEMGVPRACVWSSGSRLLKIYDASGGMFTLK